MNARFIFALLLGLVAQSLPAASYRPGSPGASFFTNGAVHTIEIEIGRANMATLRSTPREYVRATVRAGGQTYTNVGVHLKGVATFRPIDDQPSLTLHFSKFDRQQRFHGLRKIHLNNGKEDPTFIREAISAEMFEHAGLPATRVTHGRIRLNGRDLGPYVIKESFTKEFLARHFEDTGGNLYDSGFRLEVTSPLELLQGPKPEDRSDLQQLAAAAQDSSPARRWTGLARSLDTNNFSRYLAMQTLIANWDGYSFYRNNYRIYHDPDTDRLFFMPHGMDQTFTQAGMPLFPARWEGLVARAYVSTAPGRAHYLQQVGLLYTNTWNANALVRRVNELAALLKPHVAAQDSATVAEHAREVIALRQSILERGTFLSQQFRGTNWMNPSGRRTVPWAPVR